MKLEVFLKWIFAQKPFKEFIKILISQLENLMNGKNNHPIILNFVQYKILSMQEDHG